MSNFAACALTAGFTSLIWFFIFDFKKSMLELNLMKEKGRVRELLIQYETLLNAFVILQNQVGIKNKPLDPLEAAYKVFGLDKRASFQEVKNKYRILVKKYHPDALKTKDSKKFLEVNEAYALIKSKVST